MDNDEGRQIGWQGAFAGTRENDKVAPKADMSLDYRAAAVDCADFAFVATTP